MMARPERIGRSAVIPLVMAASVLGSILTQMAVWPLHALRQHELREEMEHRILVGLPDDEVTCLRMGGTEFAATELQDEGRELELGGVMYDIISLERSGDQVIIRAVRDDPETRLNSGLDRLVWAEMEGDQSEEGTACAAGSWAPYHEGPSRILFVQAPWLERYFVSTRADLGRDGGSIDPGPPRQA